jgi:hypothetical protein
VENKKCDKTKKMRSMILPNCGNSLLSLGTMDSGNWF